MRRMTVTDKLRHTAWLAWLMLKSMALHAWMTLLALVMIWRV